MPPSTTKRVVLYRWDRPAAEGIIDPASYLANGVVEWVTADGRLHSSSFEECKALCFVSEWIKTDLFTDHNLFERRPKLPGLWTRFHFRDESVLDGLLPHNLIDWPAGGYLVVPPQARANRQKVFIPRQSLLRTELRGIIGGSSATHAQKPELALVPARQLRIFD